MGKLTRNVLACGDRHKEAERSVEYTVVLPVRASCTGSRSSVHSEDVGVHVHVRESESEGEPSACVGVVPSSVVASFGDSLPPPPLATALRCTAQLQDSFGVADNEGCQRARELISHWVSCTDPTQRRGEMRGWSETVL